MKNRKNATKTYSIHVGAPFAGNIRETGTTVPYKRKNISGITLIALVITIIILLILAGVVLNLTLGEHGIIKMAENAGRNYVNVAEDEQKKLGDFSNEVDNIINGNSKGNSLVTPPSQLTVGVGGEAHTAKKIQYSWAELSQIAKVISDNYGTAEEGKINNDTAEVVVSINGKVDTLGIGDWTTVSGKQVRILGFNHDGLVDQTIYGGTNTYAGISFEYAEITTTVAMNSSNTNSGGWGACELRSALNISGMKGSEIEQYIKEVNKQYIATYNNPGSVTTSSDKMWLLSCSEIWSNGIDGQPYGYAIAKEGEQYKYYEDINATSSSENSNLVKKNNSSINIWWLRSPNYYNSSDFCGVYTNR